MVHDLLGHIDCYRGLASALGPDQPVYALRSFSSDLHDLQSIGKLATSYLIDLRAFDRTGPYILGGFSFGGAVAFEMARQLEDMGEETLLVVLIDTWIPVDSNLRLREQLSILWKKVKERDVPFLASKAVDKCVYWSHRTGHLFLNLVGRTCHGLGLEHPSRVRLAHLEKANRCLLCAYQPRVYRGSVLLAACSRKLEILSKRSNPFFGWDILVGHQFEICAINAEHLTIMKEPSICEVAQLICEKLRAVDSIKRAHTS